MAKCYECENYFCFDHIIALQVHPKHKENEPVRDVCAKCKKKFGYKDL